jgi:hypothetical protein
MDTEVDFFIGSALISDLQIISALNTLVVAAKACKAWFKVSRAYPYVGGNAFAHSWGLGNSFSTPLIFVGGWTHDALGITGDGVTTYVQSGINFAVDEAGNDNYMGMGSYATLTNTAYDMGVKDALTNNFVGLLRRAGGVFQTGRMATSALSLSVLGVAGLAGVQRNELDDNVLQYIQNDTVVQSGVGLVDYVAGAFPNKELYFGTFNNNGTTSIKSLSRFSFHYIHQPFTPDEYYGWNVAMQFFQQSLNRGL